MTVLFIAIVIALLFSMGTEWLRSEREHPPLTVIALFTGGLVALAGYELYCSEIHFFWKMLGMMMMTIGVFGGLATPVAISLYRKPHVHSHHGE